MSHILIFFLYTMMINGLSLDPSCYSNTTCGKTNITITYPFSLASNDHYCSNETIKLVCRDDNSLILNLGENEYSVKSINYSAETISLVDLNINEGGSNAACRRPHHNLTLQNSIIPLFYTLEDYNLTFFLNCTTNGLDMPGNIVSCLSSENIFSYVFLGNYPYEYNELIDEQHCEKVMVAPARSRGIINVFERAVMLNETYGKFLDDGFDLSWSPPVFDCFSCIISGGQCEQNRTDVEELAFACSCNGILHSQNCSSNGEQAISISGEVSQKKKVIIGVSVAIGGGLLLSTIFFFVYRQNRLRKRSSSAVLLRSSSLEPSSRKDSEMGIEYPTQTFSYVELEEATDGFSASQELGDGGFGTVYKGKLRDGRAVAVKRLYQNNYKRVEQFINEIYILSRLRHQNLVALYGCSSRHSRELLLVYEYVPNGTVADHLHGHRAAECALTWPIRLSIAIETADALAYLHATEPQIIHRDVKTTNILLDTSFHVKVADFGLSRLFPVDATHVSTAPQGTPGYVDPEYHQCYQLTDKSDVYSFGVVLVELISSKHAVDIRRNRHEINLSNMAINKIQNNELDQLVDPTLGYQTDMEVKCMITQVAELAFRCLQPDREMRPAIKEVLVVLKGIENRGNKGEKMVQNDAAIARNDAPLLKSTQRYSPNSVQDWLSSSSTMTANSSG